MSTVGKAVRKTRKPHYDALRCDALGNDLSGRLQYADVQVGWEGTVVAEREDGRVRVTVYVDPNHPLHYYRVNHKRSYENNTYEFRNHSTSQQLIIEHPKEMDLFVTTTTEVIEGVVGQVKYGDTIVWQSDPAPTTDDSGDVSLTKQHEAAAKAAQDKVKEVVKKQFA